MASHKRTENKITHRLSDRDSGYEDLSTSGRADGSFENIKRIRSQTSFTDWSPLTLMQSQEIMNKGVNIVDRRCHADENRKREVDAGKIGISHMIRQWNSKIKEQELPNLKPAIKASDALLDVKQYPVRSRKPRGKRRSKSADGRPVRTISMFNPIYTKILSPREMKERTKWAEKLRMDALLDEEYYKLPYEEINKEIALGRYSRSEPKLNWKRKQRKKVSFSADIDQTDNKNESKTLDGGWNWKEDSGFHDMDCSSLKSIVKETYTNDTNLDDSNVFSDDSTLSDSLTSDSDGSTIDIDSPQESELQSLLSLVKEQEKRLSMDEVSSSPLTSETQSQYIKDLIFNRNVSPRVPKAKPRKLISTYMKAIVEGNENKPTNSMDNTFKKSVVESKLEEFAYSPSSDLTPNVNLPSPESITKLAIGLTEKQVLNESITNDNITLSSQHNNISGMHKVTAIVHNDVNTFKDTSANSHIDDKHNIIIPDKQTNSEMKHDLPLQSQINGISEKRKSNLNIVENPKIINNNILAKVEDPVVLSSESKEEARKRFFELIPQPVKTLSGVEWHRDFQNYSSQSPLKQAAENTFTKPESGKIITSAVGGRIKSPCRSPKLMKADATTKKLSKPSKLNIDVEAIRVSNTTTNTLDQIKLPINATKIDKSVNVNKQIIPQSPPKSSKVTNVDNIKCTPIPLQTSNSIIVDETIRFHPITQISTKNGNADENIKITQMSNVHNDLNVNNIDHLKNVMSGQTISPVLKKGDSQITKHTEVRIKNGPQVNDGVLYKNQLIDRPDENKLHFVNSNKGGIRENNEKNNNLPVNKELLTINNNTLVGKFEEEISSIDNQHNVFNNINQFRQTDVKDSIVNNEDSTSFKKDDSNFNREAFVQEELDKIKYSNNKEFNNYNSTGPKIIEQKLILEDEFFCESDNSDNIITDTSESTETESEEDVTESSGESSASYNIEHSTHEVSVRDSPDETLCSVNQHHEYFKEEGQSARATDKEKRAVRSIVRRKVEETVTDIVNVTSVVSPHRRGSKSKMESEVKEPLSKTVSINSLTNTDQPIIGSRTTAKSEIESREQKTHRYEDQLPYPKTPPLALPRKSLFNGVSNKKELRPNKRSIHKKEEDNTTFQNIYDDGQNIKQNGDKKIDNMTKIKEAFMKAGLNPKVFDDLDHFDKHSALSRSEFRENFVNMFMTKQLDFTDYNIHLRTKTNSATPNLTVTRKYLPLSIINEQMTWMRETPVDKPIYTCHIASSNENIHKAAFNLSKAASSGTTSPEDCYEYNDGDESPIDNQTTSPTPSWTESSSSGCYSACCSPTPLPTTGKNVPMPTSL